MTHVLATNDGPHPAKAWAEITAVQLVDLTNLQGDTLMMAIDLRDKIAAALEVNFVTAQFAERNRLKSDPASILTPINADVSAAVAVVLELMADTVWHDHFHRPEHVAEIEHTLLKNLNTAHLIERLYFRDRNPENEHVARWNG